MGEQFGALLRRHRLAASLTQEQLAEQAMVSATAIAALERGRRRAPRLSTVRQLGMALGLNPDDLAALAEAASIESRSADPYVAETAAELSGTKPAGDETLPAPEESLPPVARRRWRTTFVGRQQELKALLDAFASRRRVTLVLGEPGIGKTRLVAEFARRAAAGGAAVVWGRCREERLGPYMAFVEILRHAVALLGPERSRDALGGRGELTRLLPEVETRLGPLAAPVRADAGTEQRLLFEAVAALLAAVGSAVVVVDDLHWADESTVHLVRYLALEPALDDLTLVITARRENLTQEHAGLLDLERHTDACRLHLGALGPEELRTMIGDLGGAPAGDSLVTSVATTSDGNPFFAEEVTLHLLDAELVVDQAGALALHPDAPRAGVPERVRETLLRRLLAMPADALELLTAGAVAGRQFEISLAATAIGLEGAAVLDAADDCLLSGMVLEIGPGRFMFRHALVQETVDGRLSSLRRGSLHRRLAELLENEGSDDPVAVADVARHWAAAASVNQALAPTAAMWAMRAGDLALAAAAADEAIARYEEASALWEHSTRGHVDAMVRLGTALQYRGRAEEADERFRSALALAVGLGDVSLRAQAAIGLGRRYPYWSIDAERVDALEGALEGLPADDGLALRVMAMLVTHLVAGFTREQAARRDDLAAAVRKALTGQPDPTVLRALGATRFYDSFDEPVALARAASQLLGVGQADQDLHMLATARLAQVLSALDRGAMGELVEAASAHQQLADLLDEPRERAQALTVRSTIATIEGRYHEAQTFSEQAAAFGRSAGDMNAELVYFAQAILRSVDLDQAADMLPLLTSASEYHHIVSFTSGIALCAALAGDHGLARAHLETFCNEGLHGLPRGADRLTPLAFLSHACALAGEQRHATSLYEALVEEPVAAVRVGPGIGWWGPLDHHLGSLCRVLGRPGEARARLHAALEVERRMGARPFMARTLVELARVPPSDGNGEAEQLLEAAASIAADLAAPGLLTGAATHP